MGVFVFVFVFVLAMVYNRNNTNNNPYNGREEGPTIQIGGAQGVRFQWQSKPGAIDYSAEAWLGLRTVVPQDVQCIAIYQDPTPEMWVTDLAVQKWVSAFISINLDTNPTDTTPPGPSPQGGPGQTVSVSVGLVSI